MSERLEPPGEAGRAVRAIVLGAALGTVLALLARAHDRRARRAAT
ncbi:MAG TPA: hypothetical protein VI276_06925 [Actinomycetota bacterium]|jgi:hypothetical protein